MITNEQIIDALTEAIEVNRENKICCNNALGWARGRLRVLGDEIATKNEEIAKLQARVAELEGKGSENDVTDDWVACSERLPEMGKEVMIQMTNPLLHPRIGYLSGDGKSWWVIMSALNGAAGKIEADAVIAWRELPKRYEPPVVEEEPVEEEVEFASGDHVVCISDGGSKVHAIYIDEDKEVYWILDKSTSHPQDILKTHWHLKKCDKYVSTMEWLLTKED